MYHAHITAPLTRPLLHQRFLLLLLQLLHAYGMTSLGGQRTVGLPLWRQGPPAPVHADPVVALFCQSGHVRFRSDPCIHDHRRLLAVHAGVQARDSLLQCAGLRDVAWQDLAGAREARAIEHQPERDQRTIGTLLLRTSVDQILAVLLAMIVRVGNNVESKAQFRLDRVIARPPR